MDKEQKKAWAASITGPRKIFNDAALAIEKLSKDVESYWRRSAPEHYYRMAEYAHHENQLEQYRQKTAGVIGDEIITADIASLAALIKDLPPDDQKTCADIIAQSKAHVRSEQVSYAYDERHPAFFPPEPVKEIDAFFDNYRVEYANCHTRICYHRGLEWRRGNFENQALEGAPPPKEPGIDVFKAPLRIKTPAPGAA